MTNCCVTLFRLKMHMISFLDSILDVVFIYYCVARVTCLVKVMGIIRENLREQAEELLELWRNSIDNKGLRVSRSKTEYLPPSCCHANTVRPKLDGEEIENAATIK